MCTLTYIPDDKGYTLTHNRDERSNRPSSNDFKKQGNNGQTLYFPQDLEARGSWMAFSDKNISACILNGGREPYQRKPPYRRSRGLVVLDSFEYATARDFYKNYDFSELEPFTLIRIDQSGLYGIIHDEEETIIREFSQEEPHIWSSTTLYKPEIRDAKEKIFSEWLKEKDSHTPEEIVHFHLHTGEKALHNQFVVDYGDFFRTVSLTQIAVKEQAQLTYLNLVAGTDDKIVSKLV